MGQSPFERLHDSPRFALTLRAFVPHVPNPFHELVGSREFGRTRSTRDVVDLTPTVSDDDPRRRNPVDPTRGDDHAGILWGQLRLSDAEQHCIGIRGWVVVR